MVIRDLFDEEDSTIWSGLGVEIAEPAIPRFRIEYATGGFVRVTQDGLPLLWARLFGGFRGCAWLRAAPMPRLLPPLTTAAAYEAAERPARWTRAIAQTLAQAGVLHAGQWELTPAWPETASVSQHTTRTESWLGQRVRVIAVREPGVALAPADAGQSAWDLDGGGWLIGLRRPSPSDAGRVKAWRKLARQGLLPPLVIYFVSALDGWLLLDGHDRLQAATIENVPAPMLSVSAVRERPGKVDPDEQSRVYRELERRLGGAGPLDLGTTRTLRQTFRHKFPPATFTVSRTRA